MHHPYCRPLDTLPLAENFLREVLGVPECNDSNIVRRITKCEIEINNLKTIQPTFYSEDFREPGYRTEPQRWQLRKDIVRELFTLTRPNNDNDIKLGATGGGAIPNSPLQKKRQAFLIIGLPASGKSYISETIAEKFGAIILDSDYSKRKLPEFRLNAAGADLVHKESGALIWGGAYPSISPADYHPLVKLCTDEGINVVIPTVGNILDDGILKMADNFRKYNYNVHLTLVSLDRLDATIRALQRFIETDRYVPLSLIFDAFSNEPILNYHRIKSFHHAKFESYGKVSTKNRPLTVVENLGDNPVGIF